MERLEEEEKAKARANIKKLEGKILFVPKRQTRLHLFQRIRVLQQKIHPKDVERNIMFKEFKINLETLTNCVNNQRCVFCNNSTHKSSFLCETHYDEDAFILYKTAVELPPVPIRRGVEILESEGKSILVTNQEIHVPKEKILYFNTKDTSVNVHSLFKSASVVKSVVANLTPCLFPHLGVPPPEFPPQAETKESQNGLKPDSYYN